MPTGGVTRENAGEWIRAGACAIGVGTALVDGAAVAERRFGDISPRRGTSSRPCPTRARGPRARGGGAMKTVCFGEIMLRLSPPGFERFFQSPLLQATFGGGEANVAVSLAHFGVDSHYVTRVPANPVGDAAVRALRAEGVRRRSRRPRRLAARHLLRGDRAPASARRLVVYDRAHSAMSELAPGIVPWPDVFAGADWFHCHRHHAGARRRRPRARTREAVEAARRAGVRVSVDLNFRRKLWSEQEAQAVMRPLMPLGGSW